MNNELQPVSDSDHADPGNTLIKPSLSTLEGKIALVVALVGALGTILPALLQVFPNQPWLVVAISVVSALTTVLVSLGLMKQRKDLKQAANEVAGEIAVANINAAARVPGLDRQ